MLLVLLFVLTAAHELGYSQPIIEKTAAAGIHFSSVNMAMAAPVMQAQDPAPNDSTTTEKVSKTAQQIKNLFSYGKILAIVIIVVVTYFLVRLLVTITDKLAERTSKYRLITKRLIPVMRIFMWAIAIYIIIAGIINPPFQTVIAVAASIGIAVGFAAQGVVKNVFGGFIIILDRPFQIGDKIAMGDHYGEVQQIGLRSTRLVTPDDSVVSIPNGEVIQSAVSNANSGAIDCQVVAEIYLPATTDIDFAKRIARKAAVSSRYVYLKKPIVIIAVNEVYEKNFVIKLRVKAYVLDIRFEFPFQSDMTEQITAELNRRGIIPVQETSAR